MGIGEVVNITNLFGNVKTAVLLPRIILSIVIIILGVIIGKLINFGLKNIIKKTDLEKKIKKGIIDLTLTVIRWSVYIIFFNTALNYLDISNLTRNIINILMTIPTFVGGLIIILIGFSVAYFLKSIIKNSEIKAADIVSEVVFYFVVYISGVYAIKTALISLGEQLTNYLIMILTGVFAAAGAYFFIKKSFK